MHSEHNVVERLAELGSVLDDPVIVFRLKLFNGEDLAPQAQVVFGASPPKHRSSACGATLRIRKGERN